MDCWGEYSARYHFPDTTLPFEDIGAVWNRRVRTPELPTIWSQEPDLQNWMIEEVRNALYISFTLFKAPVVNPWETNERIKFNKIFQMRRAAELGFEVPLTCLTNNLEEMQQFWETASGNVVLKKIRKGIFQMSGGKRYILHTAHLSPHQMSEDRIADFRFAPVLLQEHLEKKYDIRSVIIGERVFSFAIHSQESSRGKTDFRTAALLGESLRHEAIDLGQEVNNKLVCYSRSFGLAFGVVDLVLTKDEHLVFLEDNPNGQWGWLEEKTGVLLSLAFAEYFTGIITSARV